MQKLNRVVKLEQKYTELANKNRIFQQYLATLTKMKMVPQIGGASHRAGMSKVRPVGQIRPAIKFCPALGLI